MGNPGASQAQADARDILPIVKVVAVRIVLSLEALRVASFGNRSAVSDCVAQCSIRADID